MGLEFSNIPDKHGAAIYMIHDGTTTQSRQLERLAHELNQRQKSLQVLVLSVRDRQAETVRDFYDLSPTSFPHILVIADDDQILHSWSGAQLPTSDQLSYAVSSVNGI